jgi:3-deoxy-D-manno-octulosonate 8-phosphate phosphatase (KDO 8-P phosphatase)
MSKYEIIFLDIDGTLTDGKILFDNNLNEMKSFNVKDGLQIKRVLELGVEFIVVSGRKSKINEYRMRELGITNLYQSITNKCLIIKEILSKKKINLNKSVYIGDDMNDLEAMLECGFKACPLDANKEIFQYVDYVSSKRGGEGAVMDILIKLFPY